jgi:hypothetical protein
MKTFVYDDHANHLKATMITEEEIIARYWSWWSESMSKKYGSNSKLINKENCINDWVLVHWAWEKKT